MSFLVTAILLGEYNAYTVEQAGDVCNGHHRCSTTTLETRIVYRFTTWTDAAKYMQIVTPLSVKVEIRRISEPFRLNSSE